MKSHLQLIQLNHIWDGTKICIMRVAAVSGAAAFAAVRSCGILMLLCRMHGLMIGLLPRLTIRSASPQY